MTPGQRSIIMIRTSWCFSYLISKWHFERNYFQHHFYDIKNLWSSFERTFFCSALGQKPEFTKLVSKMINHTRFIAIPGLSHWQKIKSFGIRELRFFGVENGPNFCEGRSHLRTFFLFSKCSIATKILSRITGATCLWIRYDQGTLFRMITEICRGSRFDDPISDFYQIMSRFIAI